MIIAAYLIGWGARWAWRRCNRGEGESDKSPLYLFCRVASQTTQQTCGHWPTCCGLVGDFPVYGEVTGKLV